MIDIKKIRENPQKFTDGAKAKKFSVDIDRLLAVDTGLMDCRKRLQDIATEKNSVGKSIPKLSADEKQAALARLGELKNDEAGLNEQINDLQPEFDEIMQQVPQLPADDVPSGEDDTENVELRKWGTIREFDFEQPVNIDVELLRLCPVGELLRVLTDFLDVNHIF